MTEDDAAAWIAQRWGGNAIDRLRRFAVCLERENAEQNLIAASTLPAIWTRHFADSAQLIPLVGDAAGLWMDVGSGGGLPGIVVAICREAPLILVEPRRRRADFLERMVDVLGLAHASVRQTYADRVRDVSAQVISARAVAPVDTLLHQTRASASTGTIYVLPRGRLAPNLIRSVEESWRGVFHVEQSLTDEASSILIATKVAPR